MNKYDLLFLVITFINLIVVTLILIHTDFVGSLLFLVFVILDYFSNSFFGDK